MPSLRLLRETADLLELEGANPFRVRAHQSAARTVEELPQPVAQRARGNGKRLTDLPGIGEDLAGKIEEIWKRPSGRRREQLRFPDT